MQTPSRTSRLVWLVLLTFLAVGRLRAEIVESITSLVVTNSTAFVIASDAANGTAGYERDAIVAKAVVLYQRSTATTDYVFDYTYDYQLVDDAGTPQTLVIGAGTGTTLAVTLTVDRTLIPIVPSITTTVRLQPATRLDPYRQYKVTLKLLRKVHGSLPRPSATGDAAETALASYYHFPGTNASDADVNVIPFIDGAGWTKTYLLKGGAGGLGNLVAAVNFHAFRYDRYNLSPANDTIAFRFLVELRDDATDAIVPLVQSSFDVSRSMPTYTIAAIGPIVPSTLISSASLPLVPAGQLDSVNKTYKLRVTIAHFAEPLDFLPQAGNSADVAATRLLHFNGHLYFGAIDTVFTSVGNVPPANPPAAGSIPTQLGVNLQSGAIVGAEDHTYGDGSLLSVNLLPNGDATLSGGSAAVTSPSPDTGDVANVRFTRGTMTLDTSGAISAITTVLPAGFGIAGDPNHKLLLGLLPFGARRLGQDLLPLADPSESFPIDIWANEETKPVWMKITAGTWVVAAGRFDFDAAGDAVYVRRNEFQALAASGAPADATLKRSNERYYEFVDGVASPQIVVKADAKRSARLTASLKFRAGAMGSHFPYQGIIAWGAGGEQVIEDDLVVAGTSSLPNAVVLSPYQRDCTGNDCPGGAGLDYMTFKSSSGPLLFTPDGGFYASGKLSTNDPVSWGWIGLPAIQKFAHETEAWDTASFLMSGFFLRGDQATGTSIQQRPGTILFSGFTIAPDASVLAERPKSAPYEDGFADYAGLNFRVVGDGARKAHSVLAGKPTGDYPLTGRSKYYVRLGGVNGIHEAVFKQFPPSFKLYGYPINFDNFGLSFLDGVNVDSRTQGSIELPEPSKFVQNFEKLKFSCLGALEDAQVPAAEAAVAKVMNYWQADFYTRAIQFQHKAADACDPGKGILTLGVDAYAVHVDGTLHGVLGYHPDGNLVTLADCEAPDGPLDPPFDSRLKMPNQFTLKGPKDEKYAVTPVSDAYLSNWDYRGSNPRGVGFLNFAAKLDVPFFEDLRIHAHTSANRENTGAPLFMMGGWPSKGFSAGGADFFSDKSFDKDNKGFPDDVDNVEYEEGKKALGEKYHVRAQRDWLDLINLDAPLNWSSSGRAFSGYAQVKKDLLVISAEYEPKYLSARHAELTFGLQYEGMPQINLANLAFDQLGGLEQAFTGVIETQVLDKGFDALNGLVGAQIQKVMDPVLDDLLDPPINAIFGALSAKFDAGQKKFTVPLAQVQNIVGQYCGVVAGAPTSFRDILETGLLGDLAGKNGFIKQIDGKVADGEAALAQIQSLLHADPDGNRTLVTTLLKQLVKTLVSQATDSPIAQSLAGMAADIAGGAIDPKLNQFLKEAAPTLDEISDVVGSVKNVLGQVRAKLGSGQEFADELKAKLNSLVASNEVLGAMQQTCNDINGYLATFKEGLDNPFTPQNAAAFKTFVRQRIGDRFFGSAIPAAFTSLLKQRLYDVEASVHEAVDSIFQQVNAVIRDTLTSALSEIDNGINGLLGSVGSSMGAGRLNGYAHIEGDSLKELRIDLYAQFKVPSEMEFNAYLQIKELDSENGENGCIGKGEKATEVRIGAKDVDVNFVSCKAKVSVEAKFTFETVPAFSILGVGAGFELNGAITFATFKITYLGAQMAFGAEENYFSGACALEFSGYKAKGGIYFGRTCTLDPFFWDPDVKEVIGKPPFTGIYAYAEVWIPISETLLGIPATCFFEVSAGIGLGAGFFAEGPTFVGKMFLGAYGSVICLASLEGDIKLIGVKNADGLQLKGGGHLEGCLGPCPFCLCVNKHVDITYKNKKWDVSF